MSMGLDVSGKDTEELMDVNFAEFVTGELQDLNLIAWSIAEMTLAFRTNIFVSYDIGISLKLFDIFHNIYLNSN